MSKKYRFFFHYNKQNNAITVHYRKKCIITNDLICKVPLESKWNTQQPKLVMRGFASSVTILDNKIIIN